MLSNLCQITATKTKILIFFIILPIFIMDVRISLLVSQISSILFYLLIASPRGPAKDVIIIVDDIWENKSWKETMELALLGNNRGSRIIITTQNSEVAIEIGDAVYKMQPLSHDNSKKLFYTRIFGDEGKCPDNLLSKITNNI